ncbi:MAG TPA: polyphosphate kinase 1, partial [Myxococcaceae bacterium]|nr:polyphosphate kinase 1 [Myxococcaceae bacterium]
AAERAEVWEQVRPGLRRVEGPSAGFPAAEHLALNVGVVLRAGHGLVELPAGMPRFVGTGTKLVPVEEVVAEHLGELFPGHEVVSHYVYRVTSNRDMRVDESPVSDLLSAMRDALEEFPRTAGPVRLEIGEEAPAAVRDELAGSLGLTPREVTVSRGRVNLGDVGAIAGLERPELKSAPVRGVTPGALREAGSVMEAMSNGDILLQHPYESFAESVVRFLQEASADPDVTEIRMTVYRTSSESPIMRALIDAAKAGKQVDVLVELRARGDNAANVRWIGELERAGARVTQGVMGLKTHAKVLQVARRAGDELRTFTHLGTGNYNPSTARFYEDLGLLTANPEIGADVSELFGMLTGRGEGGGFRKLLVAPETIRTGLIEQIRQEASAGTAGRIVVKVNNLLVPRVIDALYDASRAGAQVDVIVRGMTALAPGVPDQSENVRVRSVIGGVLEHSRVFLFGTPERGRRAWIGSADMMNRNLSGRVEVLTPVEDPVLKGRLEKIVELALADDVQAWSLGPDGVWQRVPTVVGFDAQRELQRLAALPFTDGEIEQARGAVRRDLRDAKKTLSALPPLPLLPGG